MQIVCGVRGLARCPASDETGRCTGHATTLIALQTVLGGEAFITVCSFHADVLEQI